jgi:UDP-glucose 4-epimerase
VAIFFGKLVEGATPLVFGDGTQTRDYVYVGDVVAANLAALEYGGGHAIFNIGTAAETSVLELLAECQRAAGTDVTPEHRPARLGELARSALDPSLARRELGWQAATPLADGLAATLRSLAG